MDQAPVATPTAGVWTTPLEREFSAQFPPLLNYVVRLVDDVEAAPTIACEAFRQGLQRTGDLTQPGARAEILRQATELSAAFEERYAHSRAGEPICRSQTGEAAADHRDMWRGDVSHFSHSSPPPTFLSSRNARARARRVANQPRGH